MRGVKVLASRKVGSTASLTAPLWAVATPHVQLCSRESKAATTYSGLVISRVMATISRARRDFIARKRASAILSYRLGAKTETPVITPGRRLAGTK